MWRRLSRGWDWALEATGYLCAIIIFAMMLMITVTVFFRYAFGIPIKGTDEIASYSMVFYTFLGAAWVLSRNAHIRVSFVVDSLEPRLKALMYCATTFAIFLMSSVLFLKGGGGALAYYERGAKMFYTVLGMQTHLLYWPAVLGSFLLCIESARQVRKYFRKSQQKDRLI